MRWHLPEGWLRRARGRRHYSLRASLKTLQKRRVRARGLHVPLQKAASCCVFNQALILLLFLFTRPAFGAINDRVTDQSYARFQYVPGGLKVWGFDVRPTATASLYYDDNLTFSPKNGLADFVGVLAPEVEIGTGDYLFRTENYITLDYIPRYFCYFQESQFNSLDHDLKASGQWGYKKLTLGAGQIVDISAGQVVEVGQRVERKIYATSVFLKYELTGKMMLEVNGLQTISDYKAYISSIEWLNQNWLNYQIKSKLKLGAGIGLGYREVDPDYNQTYEQLLLRAIYEWTGKIDLRATFGMEFQQYDGQGPDRLAPIFALGATYRPFDATYLSLDAYQRDQNSAVLVGQNYSTTGINAAVRQRFLQRIYVTLGGGYEHQNYRATVTGVVADREDNYFFIRLNADWNLNPRWRVGAYYLRRENQSNVVPFVNNQMGVQTGFTF